MVDTRRVETGGGVMTTLASPTLGRSTIISLWQVEMSAGQAGPLHHVDAEQIWTVVSGEADMTIGDQIERVRAGDSVVLAAGVVRQVTAQTDVRFTVCGGAAARAFVNGGPADGVAVPWTA